MTLQLVTAEVDRGSPIQVRQRSVQPASNAPFKRLVIALYDFDHPSDDAYTMLPLSVGDIVTVLKQESDWMEGELRGHRGYFPASFVGEAPVPVSPAGVMSNLTVALGEFRLEQSRRSLAAIELIETERRYVGELQLLQYAILAPLQRNACDFQFSRKISSFQSLYRRQDAFDIHSDLILKHEQIEHVFSNWEAICRFNSSFLTDLEICLKKWCLLPSNEQTLGSTLLDYIPRFSLYGEYCANFGKSQLLLAKLQTENSRFIQFLESIKESGLMEKTLNSYLISPIQRVPRYQMLINELLKVTPSGHPDQVLLQKALASVIAMANDINESVRVQENHELVAKLEASFIYNPRFSAQPRQLRRHGELSKKKSARTSDALDLKPPVKRMFFLFDDLIAYAGIQAGTRKLLLRGKLLIDSSFEVVDRGETEVIIKSGKFFQIFFASVEEKKAWLVDIETCIVEQAAKRAQEVGPKTVDDCYSCKKKFGQATKFTCTYCLGLVCKNCSKSNKRDDTSKTTVCNTCFESHKPVATTRSFFGMVRGRSRSSKSATAAPQVAENLSSTQEFFVLDCPLGHGLSPKIAVEEGYACDVCDEKNIAVGEKMQSCSPCNHYVCLACQQKPGAVLSASFGSAELIGMMQQSQKTFLERFSVNIEEVVEGGLVTTSFAPIDSVSELTKTTSFSPLNKRERSSMSAASDALEDRSDTPSAGSADASELVEEESQIASLGTMEPEANSNLAEIHNLPLSTNPSQFPISVTEEDPACISPAHHNDFGTSFTSTTSAHLSSTLSKLPDSAINSETPSLLPSHSSLDTPSEPSELGADLHASSGPDPPSATSTAPTPDSSCLPKPIFETTSQPHSIVIETAFALSDYKPDKVQQSEHQSLPRLPPRRRVGYRSYSFIAPPSATPPLVPPFPRATDRIRHRSLLGSVLGRPRQISTSSSPLSLSRNFIALESVQESRDAIDEQKPSLVCSSSETVLRAEDKQSPEIVSSAAPILAETLSSSATTDLCKVDGSTPNSLLPTIILQESIEGNIGYPNINKVVDLSSSNNVDASTSHITGDSVESSAASLVSQEKSKTSGESPIKSEVSLLIPALSTDLDVIPIAPHDSKAHSLPSAATPSTVSRQSSSFADTDSSNSVSQSLTLPPFVASTLVRSTSFPVDSPELTNDDATFSVQLENAMSKLSSLVHAQLASESRVTEAKLAQTIATVASQIAKAFVSPQNSPSSSVTLTTEVPNPRSQSPVKKRAPPPPKSPRGKTQIQLHMSTPQNESRAAVIAPMVISIRRPPPPPTNGSLLMSSESGSRKPPPPPL